MSSFVDDRGTASRAKTPYCPACLVLKASYFSLAFGHAKAAAPTPNVSCVGGAMRTPSRIGMIVPSPSRRKIYLESHGAAKAPAFYRCSTCLLGLRYNRHFAHLRSIIYRTNRS